jgi:superfamily II DNA or RNA helicase
MTATLAPAPALKRWPHQVEAGRAVRRVIEASQTCRLVTLPTGAGKTVRFVAVAR